MNQACLLAFATGFLSLSIEILWIRIFGYANAGAPQAFAFVLGAYLIGIAFGALIGKWFCKKPYDLWQVTGLTSILASVCDLTSPWFYANAVNGHHSEMLAFILIMLTALLKAVAFPIAHHLGTPTYSEQVGRNVSRVYVSNIMGATLGPIFTGLFLLAFTTAQMGFVIYALLTLFLAGYCLYAEKGRFWMMLSVSALTLQFAFFLSWNPSLLIDKLTNPHYGDIINVVENQRGIITVHAGGEKGDLVAGGNIYDGRTNLDPLINSNRLNRVIVMSALVDHPRRVLMIGLSIGSWLKVITTFPDVEQIDVVELNSGYVDLMRYYPKQMLGLMDPRVNLHIDDGRRWLRGHPAEKYDMIVMNTTYHWRAYTGYLLSREFLQILKRHMNEGAVLEYNATGSPDVLKTAAYVFKFAYLYENFVIAADFDWRKKLQDEHAILKLSALKMDGKNYFPNNSQKLIQRFLDTPLQELTALEIFYNSFGREVEIITDRNLITEYKYGRQLSS